MTAETSSMPASSVGPSAPRVTEGSYLDWPAILAGGIFAMAISFVLISFGASLGLSLSSLEPGDGVTAAWLAIAAGIWLAWVMVTAFGAGGYLCGRMRRRAGDATPDEVEARDGTHGLTVWATGALVSAFLAASGVGGLVSLGASAAGSVGSAVGSVAGAATEVAAGAASSDYFANLLLRRSSDEPDAGGAGTAPAAGTDPAASDDEAEAASAGGADAEAATPSPSPGAAQSSAPEDQPSAPAASPDMSIDPAVQQEIAGILARSIAGGEMSERDTGYLAQLVAANSGLDQAAARARVDAVNAEIADAREAAIAAAEKARVAAVVFGFIAAATLLAGAVAALFGATAGGRHRDDGLSMTAVMSRRL